jgi:transcriptional regulator with XRE-family HTH domain
MGYFGNKLKRIMEDVGMTFRHISERTGVSRATINQIALGDIESPARPQVEKIMKAFEKPEHIYDLTIAHLEDEFPSPGRPYVKIGPREDTVVMKDEPPPYIVNKMDSTFEKAVERIRTHAHENESLRLVIIDLAGMC